MAKNYELTQAQDWVPYIYTLLQHVELESVLEFGLGLGTEFWVDHFKKVQSVELSIGDFNKKWTDQTREKLKDYTNWDSEYISLSKKLIDANQYAIDNKYPLKDTSYLSELKKVVEPFMKEYEYDIIFVDPGIHNRGDIVNIAFNYAPIVGCHDSDRTGRVIKNIYGYNIVEPPENYVEIHKPERYCGTTFWVDKNLEGSDVVIDVLKGA